MIKSINLKNYRSYLDEKIEFSDRITLIKGEGLSGKSNIRRAMELVKNYSYSKNNKARFAVKQDMQIKIKATDRELTLTVDKDDNVYFNSDSEKFKRKKTPHEIIEALALDDVNIQGQLEHPLIVENNSSQLSKIINRITGIETTDLIIKEINQKLRTNKTILERERNELTSLKKEKESLSDIKRIKAFIKEAKQYSNKKQLLEAKLSEVKRILLEINQINNRIRLLEVKAKVDIKLKFLEDIKQEKEDKINLKNKISLILKDIDSRDITIDILKKQYRQALKRYTEKMKDKGICDRCYSSIDDEKLRSIRKKLKNEIHTIK